MGWSADVLIWGTDRFDYVEVETNPALKTAFEQAAAQVVEAGQGADNFFRNGSLHLPHCRDVLESVIGRRAEGIWSPEEVRAVWADPRWPDPQTLSGWQLLGYWNLRKFFDVCVEFHLGLRLERPSIDPDQLEKLLADKYGTPDVTVGTGTVTGFGMMVNGQPVEDLVQYVREHVGDWVSGPLTAEVLLERLEREARLLGARDVRVEEFEGWRLISADIDWITAPCRFDVGAEIAFKAPVPLLELGEAAIRSEVLVTAFARQAVTATPVGRQVVAGEVAQDDPVWVRLCPAGCARSVAFRFPR